MVKIIIENLAQKELEVPSTGMTALQVFHHHRIDWLQTCGGKGRCTTCKMIVRSGQKNLGALTTPEQNYRSQRLLRSNERLACQAVMGGNVSIAVPNETKLPHMKYTF